MKTIYSAILSLLITGTRALAAGNGSSGENLGPMATIFITFSILIVVFQLLPSLALFSGILKGLFSPDREKQSPALAKISGKNS